MGFVSPPYPQSMALPAKTRTSHPGRVSCNIGLSGPVPVWCGWSPKIGLITVPFPPVRACLVFSDLLC